MGLLGRLRAVSRWHGAPQRVADGKDEEIVIAIDALEVEVFSHLSFVGSKHLAAQASWTASDRLLGRAMEDGSCLPRKLSLLELIYDSSFRLRSCISHRAC